MPPIFALIICIIFCFIIYKKNYKINKYNSITIWIPILWMMRCASRSISYWFGIESLPGFEEGSIHDQIFLSTLIILGLVVLIKRKVRWINFFSYNRWLFFFFAYMGISILWSEFPFVSFKKWLKTFGDLIMVLIVLTEEEPLKAIDELLRNTFILLIPLSIIFSKYFPEIGRQQSKHWLPDTWIGVATHKNTLGQLTLIAGIYFFWIFFKSKSRQNRVIAFIYLLMTIYLINGNGYSRSVTSIYLLIIAFILYFLIDYYKRNPENLSKAMVFIIIILVGMMILDFFEPYRLGFLKTMMNRDLSMSGRTSLWHDLLDLGIKKPLFGYGFGGFWTPNMIGNLKEIHTWGPGQAHNGYIEIFLNLGFAGIIIFSFVVFLSLKGALKQIIFDYEYGKLRLLFLIINLLHNYSESGFIRPNHLNWFVFLLSAMNIFREKKIRTLPN